MFSKSSKKSEKGQGLVEYAIILALVAIVTIGVMGALGDTVCKTMDSVSNALDGSTATHCKAKDYQTTNQPYSYYPSSFGVTTENAAIDEFCSQEQTYDSWDSDTETWTETTAPSPSNYNLYEITDEWGNVTYMAGADAIPSGSQGGSSIKFVNKDGCP